MSTFLLALALIVMIIGVIGTLLPVLPGTPLIFLAALGYGFYDNFKHITPFVIIVLFVLMGFTFFVDYLSGVIGARRYGASKMGTWGSLIGAILGLILFNLPGIIFGPAIGAILGEMLAGKNLDQAFKVGMGTLLGILGGTIIKIATAIIMVAYFVIKLF